MKTAQVLIRNPFIVFWLGVLTGAFIVGFIFLYRTVNKADYQNALLQYRSPQKTVSPTNVQRNASGSRRVNRSSMPESGF